MPLTKVETHNIDNYVVTTEKLSNTAVAAFAQTLTPKIATITETDNTYTALDDTAMNTSGGFIVVTGADFQSGATVIVDTLTANSTTFVNTSTLRAELPARPAGTYALYVVNPDGGTAIRVNALTYSAFPAFSTGASLSNQTTNAAFNVAISASSDSNISYSNTSALPAGTSLLSNGYFYGTVSVDVETTYSFTVKATDIELQDTSRTFSLTVTLIPPERIYAVGYNANQQLSTGDNLSRSSPTQVGALTDWNIMSAGVSTTHAIKLNGTLWGWGGNTYGLIGNNDYNTSPSSPVQIGSDTNWSKIGHGQQHIVAIRTDGTMWSWGRNQSGQLGLNSGVSRSSPTQIGSGTTWLNVAVGTYSTFAVKTDGTLWSWGLNSSGELGQNNRVSTSSPVQIGALTNWGSVAWGGRITMKGANILAVKTDGTLWTSGLGASGANGVNNAINRSSPIQIGSGTDWNYPMLGGQTADTLAMCTKTNGSLWSWGNNFYGQLGQNNTINRSSPVQLGASTNWAQGLNKIHGAWWSGPTIAAVKTDGTLWTWGTNEYGQNGRNLGNVNSSSPVQVGTNTNWNKVNYGYLHGFFQTYN